MEIRDCNKFTARRLVPVAPLLAGSIVGAIDVGVSYPADKMKTKSQTYASGAGKV